MGLFEVQTIRWYKCPREKWGTAITTQSFLPSPQALHGSDLTIKERCKCLQATTERVWVHVSVALMCHLRLSVTLYHGAESPLGNGKIHLQQLSGTCRGQMIGHMLMAVGET